jgi:diguanylate cyclase (GGDEF)-like protein
MFERALQEAIKCAIEDEILAAVFVLDLDKFKPVNDTMGHSAGDEVLIEVGRRLTGLMRVRDTVARLGGDEFGIVQLDIREVGDVERTSERILKAIRRPFIIQGQSVEVGVSIGISICPIHAIESKELVEDADVALYQAKRDGRNNFKSFNHGMLSVRDRKGSVRESLIEAMHDGSMSLVYQPIVNAKTKTLQSFEAYARWRHPVKGELPARDFLPLIEQFQLLTQFADWGVRQALVQGKLWMREALPLVPVSVNVTARQFLSLDLINLCCSLSRELDIGLEWLRFDLDETALQSDFQRAAEKIAALTQFGVLTNIDHFGRGWVPLSRLGKIRVNNLKVEGKYFEGGRDTTANDAVIAIIREVGRVLHVSIVATQIETEIMEQRATSAGIDFLQGDHISRALTPELAGKWLAGRLGDARSKGAP